MPPSNPTLAVAFGLFAVFEALLDSSRSSTDPLVLDAAGWAAKPYAPLPVPGVPGWWPANQAPGFYDAPAVFRPARSLQWKGSAHRCRS